MAFQVKLQQMDCPTQELLRSKLKGFSTAKFARFGDVGYTLSYHYKEDVDYIKNMRVRPDDVWVNTFPRSGTTRVQELVWLLKNDFDYEAASKIHLTDRYLLINTHQKRGDQKYLEKTTLEEAPSPRFIKTHIPLSLLPDNLLDTSKIIYVARDPRDVAVSRYHHNKLFLNYEGDFKSFWKLFLNDLVPYTPYFEHVKEAWALRHHSKMLFIFYEDMSRDLPSNIKQIANFLNKEVTNEHIVKLCDHLEINNFRNNKSVNQSWRREVTTTGGEGFVRKGKVGGWREHFDAEMAAQAQEWMRENLAGTDLNFPDFS